MGLPKRWGWGDELSDAIAKSSGDGGSDQSFSTRRIVESRCKTEEVEPGKFIKKCDKTEKLFRDCVGRPSEVVESTTEHTEEDVTHEVTRGSVPLGSSGSSRSFEFSGVIDGLESMEQGLRRDMEAMGSVFSRFLNAADEMANGFFRSFEFPSRDGGLGSTIREIPIDRQPEIDTSKQMDESAYSKYGSEIKDV